MHRLTMAYAALITIIAIALISSWDDPLQLSFCAARALVAIVAVRTIRCSTKQAILNSLEDELTSLANQDNPQSAHVAPDRSLAPQCDEGVLLVSDPYWPAQVGRQ